MRLFPGGGFHPLHVRIRKHCGDYKQNTHIKNSKLTDYNT